MLGSKHNFRSHINREKRIQCAGEFIHRNQPWIFHIHADIFTHEMSIRSRLYLLHRSFLRFSFRRPPFLRHHLPSTNFYRMASLLVLKHNPSWCEYPPYRGCGYTGGLCHLCLGYLLLPTSFPFPHKWSYDGILQFGIQLGWTTWTWSILDVFRFKDRRYSRVKATDTSLPAQALDGFDGYFGYIAGLGWRNSKFDEGKSLQPNV